LSKTREKFSKKLYELGKDIKDRDQKQRLEEIQDRVRELKQSASELEDENRELREKLRFKSGDYVFRHPFWYEKSNPHIALCPKCFAKNIAAPMSLDGQIGSLGWRFCLVCDEETAVRG